VTTEDPVLLEARLRRQFRVVDTDVPVGSRTVRILHPANAEDLIDTEAFERDERLPYWADLWPSAKILAAWIGESKPSGGTLLELGCGAGLVAAAAALAGYDVVASDYYDEALDFTAVNVHRNAGRSIRTLRLDWRALPASLDRFDLVVAADVLYERPYGPLVARVIDATTASQGLAVVADPGRVGREGFLMECANLGMTVTADPRPFSEANIRQTVTLFTVRRGIATGVPAP
jgi:predicted nicotinamide N-methyase